MKKFTAWFLETKEKKPRNMARKKTSSVSVKKPKHLRQKFFSFLISFLGILVLIVYLFVLGPFAQKTDAAWFNDSWGYRKALILTNNTTAETNKYGTLSAYDASDSTKYQTDCGDIRFTTASGDLLQYTVSSCGASTTFHVNVDSLPAGAQTIYLYYGNPSAINGFVSSDPYGACTNCTFGSPGTEEKGQAPIAYWKFDEGQGSVTNNAFAPAQISYIQSAINNTSGTSVSTTFSATPKVGNFIVVACNTNAISLGATAVADNQTPHNTFTRVNISQAGSVQSLAIFYAPITTANGTFTITCTHATASALTQAIHEYSGIDLFNPLDQNTTNTGTSLSPSTGSITPTVNNELVFAVVSHNGGNVPITSNAPFTQRQEFENGLTGMPVNTMDYIPSSSSSISGSWTFQSSQSWGANIASFRPAGASAVITATTWQTEDQCISGKCLYFNGTSAKVTASVNSGTAKSISFWVKPNAFSSTTGLIDFDGGTTKVTANSSGVVSTTLASPTYYINGKQTSSPTLTANQWNFVEITSATGGTASSFKVGTDNTNFTQGYFDEVKLYGSVRDANQVKADYDARGTNKGASVQTGNTQNMPAALSNGLVGYWKMEDTSDASGNGLTLTNNAATPFASGKYGNAGSFTAASSQYFNNTTSVSGVRTVSFWTFNASTTDEYINLRSDAYITSSSGTVSTGGASYTNATVYVNGTVGGTLTASAWNHVVVVADPVTVTAFEIGRANGSYNNGKIDEVRTYNRALSAADVATLYNWVPGPVGWWKMDDLATTGAAATLLDSSGNGNNLTTNRNSGNYPATVMGKYERALDPSAGIADHNTWAAIADGPAALDQTGPITVEAWIKSYVTNTCDGNSVVAKGLQAVSGSTQFGYRLAMDCNSTGGGSFRGVRFYVSPDGTSTNEVSTTTQATTSLSKNTWYHFTGVYTGTQLIAYINGVQYTAPVSYSSGIFNNTGNFTVGGMQYSGGGSLINDFPGVIDDVRVYNYARTPKQIVEDMNAGHPAPGSPVGSPVGYWKFDEGYGSTAYNSGSQGSTLNATLTGITWDQSGKFGKAIDTAGTSSSYASIPDNNAIDPDFNQDFSVSFWVKYGAGNADGDRVVEKWDGVDSRFPFSFRLSGTTGLSFRRYDGTHTALVTTTKNIGSGWHHVVGVKDGSTLRLYIDGLQDATASDTTTTTTSNTSNLYVGFQLNGASSIAFNGTVDELKIFPGALTASQVKLDMNRAAGQVWGAMSSSSTVGNDNGSTRTANSAASEYCIPGDSSTCLAPVARYDFEEGSGSTVNDTSGNGNTGIWHGTLGSQWKSGKVGKAGNFNGTDNNVDAGNVANLQITGSLTIEAWFKADTFPGIDDNNIVTKSGGTGSIGYKLTATRDIGPEQIYIGVSGDGSNTARRYTNTTITAGRWYHVVGVYNSSAQTLDIYLNGKLDNGTLVGSVPTSIFNTSFNTQIGARADASNSYLFNGLIDGVRVYNYVRTAAQVAWDYNRGNPVGWWKMDECGGTTLHDSSGNGLSATVSVGSGNPLGTCNTSTTFWGGSSGNGFGKINFAPTFDGSDDYAYVSDVTMLPTADYTYAAWLYIGALDTIYFDINDNVFGWIQSNGTLRHRHPNGSNLDSARTLATGQWYHIALVRRNNTVYTYINGVKDINTASDSTAASFSGCYLLIGSDMNTCTTPFASLHFNGKIDDFRIYNYGLTDTQIKTLYTGGAVVFAPITGTP